MGELITIYPRTTMTLAQMSPLTHRHSLVEITEATVRTAALPDRLYSELKVRILTCVLKPGERLVEKTLCEEFEISRTPLREALNRLINEKLIEIRANRGYFVTPIRVEEFRMLNEFRRIVEPQAAALAAARANADIVHKLRQHATLPRYTPGDEASFHAYSRSNALFHLYLVRATGNRLLEECIMDALDKYQRPAYLGVGRQLDHENPSREHQAIVDAIEAHDAPKAQMIMYQHIYTGEDRIARALADYQPA